MRVSQRNWVSLHSFILIRCKWNIFRLHLFGVIYWSEADIFLILYTWAKWIDINGLFSTFSGRGRAARRTVDGGRDCVFCSEMLWITLNVQFNRFIFVPLIELVFPWSLWFLSKLTCFKQFMPSSYLKHLLLIYDIYN